MSLCATQTQDGSSLLGRKVVIEGKRAGREVEISGIYGRCVSFTDDEGTSFILDASKVVALDVPEELKDIMRKGMDAGSRAHREGFERGARF